MPDLSGRLTYTFTDTFWFSAVEGEVYAMSSLITAVVFWAIFEMGKCCFSTLRQPLVDLYCLHGRTVHRRSLVELAGNPCHCIHILFQKYETTKWGIIKSAALSIVILGRDHVGYYPGRDYRCRLV